MNAEYRVIDKENVNMDGRRTMFRLYKKIGDAFVHQGAFTAPGWNAPDNRCISAALACIESRLYD